MKVSLTPIWFDHFSMVSHLLFLRTANRIILCFLYLEQVIAGLDRAVATMKKGERAILTVKPEYGFGNIETKRDLAIVPPSSILVYEVEMLDFIKVASSVIVS